MWRAVGAVVAGYVVIALFVMVGFTVAWLVLGPGFAFEAGTTKVTAGWLLMATPVNLAAALLGGWTAGAIARDGRGAAVKVLAGIVLGLGLILAILHLGAEPAVPPADLDLSTFQAASYAIQPKWFDFFVALLGGAGVLVGGCLKSRAS
ncbi:MAG: hypothetical protein AB1347_11415 [Acidobacteriota bacterium]